MATGKRVNAFQLAGDYLNALGWPNNAVTRRVLAAWFMRESARVQGSTTDIWVVGNNPLNISCTSCSNYRLVAGTHKIVVYDTPTQGLAAFNSLIHGSGPGYSGIVKAFAAPHSDPATIIKAINNSGWVTGNTNSYIGKNGVNGLLDTYNSLGAPDTYVPSDTVSGSTTIPTDTSASGEFATKYYQLLQNLGISTDPNHQITHEEATKIVASFGSIFGGGGHPLTSNFEGKTNAQIADTLQSSGTAIQNANPANVFNALTGKAVAIGALLAGVGIVVAGAFLMTKDVYNQNGGNIVDPTPIFVRE